jgi:hypothetical protein
MASKGKIKAKKGGGAQGVNNKVSWEREKYYIQRS